ncbi:unnamed protein product [Auanema sp. JU1783]|nr:unnamed protein product [Auanema sp. JU1783]
MLPAILCIVAISTLAVNAEIQESPVLSDGSIVYFVSDSDILGRALRSSLDEGKPRLSRFSERGHFPYYKGLGRK